MVPEIVLWKLSLVSFIFATRAFWYGLRDVVEVVMMDDFSGQELIDSTLGNELIRKKLTKITVLRRYLISQRIPEVKNESVWRAFIYKVVDSVGRHWRVCRVAIQTVKVASFWVCSFWQMRHNWNVDFFSVRWIASASSDLSIRNNFFLQISKTSICASKRMHA